jgi:hypothetical protein
MKKNDNLKKLFALFICVCVSASLASCGEGTESSEIVYEQSYDDGGDDWKLSLLSRAGLDLIEEPEGEKVFKEDENGNFTFTITPADTTKLSGLSSSIYSKIKNLSDDIQPFSYTEALDSENHFKVKYTLGKKKVTVEITLTENVLEASVNFE